MGGLLSSPWIGTVRTLSQISRAYHEVQFELLQEKDYDFKAFFLNPALAKGICLDLLESGYTFKFPIIIHSKVPARPAILPPRYCMESYGTVRYGAVRYGVVWCGVVWCGVVWCGVVWCGVVWCGVVWCGVVWCGVVWCGVVWCGMVWCGLE